MSLLRRHERLGRLPIRLHQWRQVDLVFCPCSNLPAMCQICILVPQQRVMQSFSVLHLKPHNVNKLLRTRQLPFQIIRQLRLQLIRRDADRVTLALQSVLDFNVILSGTQDDPNAIPPQRGTAMAAQAIGLGFGSPAFHVAQRGGPCPIRSILRSFIFALQHRCVSGFVELAFIVMAASLGLWQSIVPGFPGRWPGLT